MGKRYRLGGWGAGVASLSFLWACGSGDTPIDIGDVNLGGSAGNAGSGGTNAAGTAGSGGTAGEGGSSGDGGSGNGGSAGDGGSGNGGSAGDGGNGGAAGSGGSGGTGGTDPECTTNADCDPGEICASDICGPCSTSDQCDASDVCNPDNDTCVAGNCVTNDDCSEELACVAFSCGACTTADQCDAGEVCNPANDTCVAGDCVSNDDCSEELACVAFSCGACTTADQCDADEVCLPDTQLCAAGECVQSSDCPSTLCDTSLQCMDLVTTAFNSAPALGILDVAVVSTTLVVSGADAFLWDLDVTTFITHTFAADMDISLTSPAGTVVTLTTDNGAGNDNVFNGTIWNDSANPAGQVPYATNDGMATDRPYVNAVFAPEIAPEEPLGAFFGEDPNGTWTLTISDDLAGDIGTVAEFNLSVTTASLAPTLESETYASTDTALALADNAVTTSTASVPADAAGSKVCKVTVLTDISHTFAADLDMTLTSPTGTIVTLTSDNGAGNDNVFAGTVWDDEAAQGNALPYTTAASQVTDHPYVDLTLATPLTPEEGLAAFRGEEAQGTWTLTISDDLTGNTGTLNSWSVTIDRCFF